MVFGGTLIFYSVQKQTPSLHNIVYYIPISIFISIYAPKKLIKFNIFLSSILLFILFILAYHYEQERFVPKAISILKAQKLPVYYDNSHPISYGILSKHLHRRFTKIHTKTLLCNIKKPSR